MTTIDEVADAIAVARVAASRAGHPRHGGGSLERLVCRQAEWHLDRAAAHLEPVIAERVRRRA